MKCFMYLLIMTAVVCCTATAFATDFADDTFGILNEKQKKALNELDISSELKKADAAADAHDFDKAKEICQKLLKQSGLSSEDKRQIQAKIDSIDKKRSAFLAQKAREEQEKKQAEERSRQAAASSSSGSSRQDEKASHLALNVTFGSFWHGSVDRTVIKVKRIKTLAGKSVYYEMPYERKSEESSGIFMIPTTYFYDPPYGYYKVEVTAYQKSSERYESFQVELLVDRKETRYELNVDKDRVWVTR